MEEYYDKIEFTDWTHQLSKAPMLKAQHPDYELFKTGIHADRGSCADCHMPYKSEGGVKFTDHHIQSPLNNVENSCQVCHREKTQKLMENVYERQDKILELRTIAEKTLAATHIKAKIAWDNGETEVEMKPALQFIRHAQWRWIGLQHQTDLDSIRQLKQCEFWEHLYKKPSKQGKKLRLFLLNMV